MSEGEEIISDFLTTNKNFVAEKITENNLSLDIKYDQNNYLRILPHTLKFKNNLNGSDGFFSVILRKNVKC